MNDARVRERARLFCAELNFELSSRASCFVNWQSTSARKARTDQQTTGCEINLPEEDRRSRWPLHRRFCAAFSWSILACILASDSLSLMIAEANRVLFQNCVNGIRPSARFSPNKSGASLRQIRKHLWVMCESDYSYQIEISELCGCQIRQSEREPSIRSVRRVSGLWDHLVHLEHCIKPDLREKFSGREGQPALESLYYRLCRLSTLNSKFYSLLNKKEGNSRLRNTLKRDDKKGEAR